MLVRNIGGSPLRHNQSIVAVIHVSLLSLRPEMLSDPTDNMRTFSPPPLPPPPSSPPFSDCLAFFFFTHLSLLVPHRPPASFISLFPPCLHTATTSPPACLAPPDLARLRTTLCDADTSDDTAEHVWRHNA